MRISKLGRVAQRFQTALILSWVLSVTVCALLAYAPRK